MLPKSKVELYAAIRRDARTGRPLADLTLSVGRGLEIALSDVWCRMTPCHSRSCPVPVLAPDRRLAGHSRGLRFRTPQSASDTGRDRKCGTVSLKTGPSSVGITLRVCSAASFALASFPVVSTRCCWTVISSRAATCVSPAASAGRADSAAASPCNCEARVGWEGVTGTSWPIPPGGPAGGDVARLPDGPVFCAHGPTEGHANAGTGPTRHENAQQPTPPSTRAHLRTAPPATPGDSCCLEDSHAHLGGHSPLRRRPGPSLSRTAPRVPSRRHPRLRARSPRRRPVPQRPAYQASPPRTGRLRTRRGTGRASDVVVRRGEAPRPAHRPAPRRHPHHPQQALINPRIRPGRGPRRWCGRSPRSPC